MDSPIATTVERAHPDQSNHHLNLRSVLTNGVGWVQVQSSRGHFSECALNHKMAPG